MWPGSREGNSRDPDLRFSPAHSERERPLLSLVDPRRAGQDAQVAAPETRSPAKALVEVPQALPRGLWFRAFLQRATAAERVDLRGSELLPQDVETMWTTAARSDGRRRAIAAWPGTSSAFGAPGAPALLPAALGCRGLAARGLPLVCCFSVGRSKKVATHTQKTACRCTCEAS